MFHPQDMSATLLFKLISKFNDTRPHIAMHWSSLPSTLQIIGEVLLQFPSNWKWVVFQCKASARTHQWIQWQLSSLIMFNIQSSWPLSQIRPHLLFLVLLLEPTSSFSNCQTLHFTLAHLIRSIGDHQDNQHYIIPSMMACIVKDCSTNQCLNSLFGI